MNFAGIITEYDPFHNGHAAQIAMLRARGAQTIAVCMSSGAVQRGAIPLLPEPPRVAAAMAAGADLVVALPAPYACAGAEAFAAAGVHLLAALGCDTLAFGAETPDAGTLMRTAKLLQAPELNALLRENMAGGTTFAAARAHAAESLRPGAGDILNTPNNILGVEYCKAILAQNAVLAPLPLPRLGTGHGSGTAAEANGVPLASASLLREKVRGEGIAALQAYTPPAAYALYRAAAERGELADPAKFSVAILSRLRGMEPEELGKIRGMGEGLENRMAAALRTAAGVEELYDALKTKRYPHARLRRLVLDAALGYRANAIPALPPYLHILGAKKQALGGLHTALPCATSLAKLAQQGEACALVVKLHRNAIDFSSLCRVQSQPMGLAFTAKPVV